MSAIVYYVCPEISRGRNRAPKNRNARSGVRFLGKRSNKRIYAMRQVIRAARTSSPCCDARSGFPSNHENSQATFRLGFRERKKFICVSKNRTFRKKPPICAKESEIFACLQWQKSMFPQYRGSPRYYARPLAGKVNLPHLY